jgi:GTP-binding protein
MQIKSAEFVKSSQKHQDCPPADKPEYAFIGRSNVGKSSLINRVLGRKNLAKTSQTPGKTQLINHFLINENWHLVDLPGYGWAQVSQANRVAWEKMIQNYLIKRENLLGIFLLIDARHDAQQIDLEFMQFLGEKALPFVLVFTKADKLSNNQLQTNLTQYQKKLLAVWEELPTIFVTSAEDGRGCTEILTFIAQINEAWRKENK